MTETLSREEVEQRVAILKRYRKLLEEQRNAFRDYLNVLEKQEKSIEAESTEVIVAQAELEHKIVASLSSLHRVTLPLEKLYSEQFSTEDEAIPELKTDLENLKQAVLEQNQKNRDLLKTKMGDIRNQIKTLNNPSFNPYAKKASIYSQNNATASILDVEL